MEFCPGPVQESLNQADSGSASVQESLNLAGSGNSENHVPGTGNPSQLLSMYYVVYEQSTDIRFYIPLKRDK